MKADMPFDAIEIKEHFVSLLYKGEAMMGWPIQVPKDGSCTIEGFTGTLAVYIGTDRMGWADSTTDRETAP